LPRVYSILPHIRLLFSLRFIGVPQISSKKFTNVKGYVLSIVWSRYKLCVIYLCLDSCSVLNWGC